jgi:hypothetical protein
MLRRHLEQLGHGYKLSEIREALDILVDTRIVLEDQTVEPKTGRQRRTRDFAGHHDALHSLRGRGRHDRRRDLNYALVSSSQASARPLAHDAHEPQL